MNKFRSSTYLLFIFILFVSCTQNYKIEEDISLWPEIEPFQTDYLKASNIHEVYYELCGNPDGIPVFVLHGGPGVGCSPYYRRFFDPSKFLIVLHDQRGCGRSKPRNELRENTTQHLVEDIEKLRNLLELDKIILFGGSWGSTLSLAYAETYPANVKSMVLRGIWLGTEEEDHHLWNGIPKFFPEIYDSLLNILPGSLLPLNGENNIKLFQINNPQDLNKCLKIADRYYYKSSRLNVTESELNEYYASDSNMKDIYTNMLLDFYYASKGVFLEENQLLRDTYKIKEIPATIINGRYDMNTPPIFAWRLHKKLPKSKLIIVEKAGHSMRDKPIERELLKAMEQLQD